MGNTMLALKNPPSLMELGVETIGTRRSAAAATSRVWGKTQLLSRVSLGGRCFQRFLVRCARRFAAKAGHLLHGVGGTHDHDLPLEDVGIVDETRREARWGSG